MKTTRLTWTRLSMHLLVTILIITGLGTNAEKATLRYSGTDFEGRKAFRLEWNAQSNAAYIVQSATNLTGLNPWKTLDVVMPQNGSGVLEIKGRSIPENSVEFFRLILPQPKIFTVEPAVVAPGVAVDFHILGQCFPTNAELRINSVPQSGILFQSDSMLVKPSFIPTSPGTYVFDLVVSDQIVSSFTVLCADALASPELVLQGPPEMPPAAPQALFAAWASRKGYLYYQAQSQLAPAGLSQNPYYVNSQNAGAMPDTRDSKNYRVIRSTENCDDGDDDFSPLNGVAIPKFVDVTKAAQISAAKADIGRVWSGGPRINPATGETECEATDLVIPGRGLDFIWTRTYNSRIGRDSSPNGWTFSYDISIQPLGGDILIRDGTGRADRFRPNSNGVYTCPEFFREGTLSNGVFTLTFADGGTWEFNPLGTAPEAGKLASIKTKNPASTGYKLSYDTAGRLMQIVDDLNRTNTVAYDTAGRLASVTDFSGRTVSYGYYGSGETGGSPGDLKSVTSPPVTGTPNGNDFPDGKTLTYTYSTGYTDERQNHLLLSVKDANGQPTHQFVYQHNETDYEFLRCVSAQAGTNTPMQFRYFPHAINPAHNFATTRCIINDPEGNVREYFYDARNRCVMERDFTGRATPGLGVTETANRPTGKLRSTDPDFYETQWGWNNDSLRISTKEPTKLEIPNLRFVYQSDFDSATPPRKRADLRVVRELAGSPVDLDGDGVAETTERVWRYEYDPRFGTSEASGKYFIHAIHAGRSLREYNPIMGIDLAPEGSGVAIKTKGTGADKDNPTNLRDGAGKNPEGMGANTGFAAPGNGRPIKVAANVAKPEFGFVTSATDPRGGVTAAEYNSNGCMTRYVRTFDRAVSVQDHADLRLTYNSHDQLTAITNAPDAEGRRRVDTLSYYETGPQAGGVESITIDEPGLHLTSNFEYDARGNLTRCVDPRGNDSLFTYNSLDQLVRRRGAVYIYSGGSPRIASHFAYDANNNLVQVSTELRDADGTLAGSKTDNFQYDVLHRLTEAALAVDASHALTNRFLYDGNGQCIQVLGGDAVSGVDPHQAVAFQYDERGLPFRAIAAPGSAAQSTTQWDYDAHGNVTHVTEGLEGTPSVTMVVYDGFTGGGRGFYSIPQVGDEFSLARGKAKAWMVNNYESHSVFVGGKLEGGKEGVAAAKKMMGWPKIGEATRISSITDPMGNVTTFNRDACDNLKVVRHFGETNDVPGSTGNIRLAETRCDYDSLNRRVRVHAIHFGERTQLPIGDGAATTTFSYAPNGQCVGITNDLGHAINYDYDTAGRVYLVKTPRTVVQTHRDAAGNPTNIVQTDTSDLGGAPQVFSITNVFDPLNRCISSTDNVGNTESWQYDSLGRVTAQFNPREYKRTFAYDLLGRRTLAVADLDGDGVMDLAQDYSERATWSASSGRLLSTADSHTNTTSYAYDSLGRCTTITRADGTQRRLVWSPRSNLIREEDANGSVITNLYDLNDRVIHRDIAANTAAGVSAATTFETFTYDGLGRLRSHQDDDCNGNKHYDSLDNCVSETLNGLTTTSTYDSLGNRLSLTYPGGRLLNYTYDANNNCTAVSESGAMLANFSHDGASRLSRINYGNGTRADITFNGLASPPNAAGDYGFGQVSRVRHEVAASAAAIDDRTFSYDRAQNKTHFTINATMAKSFEYDAIDRLITSLTTTNGALASVVSYDLDRMGNRTNVTGAACSGAYVLDAALPPADFQMNQYTASPCEMFSYDASGNLTNRASVAGAVSYQFDYANRLVLIQKLNSDTGDLAPLVSYTYDALGRRVSRTLHSGTATTTKSYCYDGNCAIETREGTSVIDSLLHISEDRDLIGLRHYGQNYFLHTDDQGNTVALTDATGTVVERYDYDDYGTVTFLAADGTALTGSDGLPATSSSVGNAFLFHGMEWDADAGVHGKIRSKIGGAFNKIKNNPLYEDKGHAANNPFYDSKTGREVSGNNPSGDPAMDLNDVNRDRTLGGSNPWSLKKEEGGRHTPFHNRTTLKTYFQTGDKPTQAQSREVLGKTGRKMLSMLD